MLKSSIKEMNISFKMPEGYSALDSAVHFSCGDGNISNMMIYSIVNKDSSVLISFAFLQYPNAKAFSIIKQFSPDYDNDTNYLRTAQSMADTIHHKIIFYDKEYSRKAFNADDAGEYIRNCYIPYLNKYMNNRVVFFASKGRGHVEITYFYTDKEKDRIEKDIKKTEGMLKYND
jgi:hypothetical protein